MSVYSLSNLHRAYLDRHLVDMDTLLDTKLGNENIESRVEDTDDTCLPNDRAKALCEVGDEKAQEQVSGLLLSEFGVSLLAERRKVNSVRSLIARDWRVTNMLHC